MSSNISDQHMSIGFSHKKIKKNKVFIRVLYPRKQTKKRKKKKGPDLALFKIPRRSSLYHNCQHSQKKHLPFPIWELLLLLFWSYKQSAVSDCRRCGKGKKIRWSNDQMQAIRPIALALIWISLSGHLLVGNHCPSALGSANYKPRQVMKLVLHTDWSINTPLKPASRKCKAIGQVLYVSQVMRIDCRQFMTLLFMKTHTKTIVLWSIMKWCLSWLWNINHVTDIVQQFILGAGTRWDQNYGIAIFWQSASTPGCFSFNLITRFFFFVFFSNVVKIKWDEDLHVQNSWTEISTV